MMLTQSLSRHYSLCDKDVHQPLQRLHIFLRQQIVVHRDRNEMHKATIQLEMAIDVPEGIVPVAMIQMCIAAEHLLYDALDVLVEVLRKAGRFANPVTVGAREGGQWLVEVCGAGGDGGLRAGGSAGIVARGVGGRGGGRWRFGGEDLGVVDFADDPPLDADNV